jgi:NNP family nitrate/nitrite transporter-like MFS transporter
MPAVMVDRVDEALSSAKVEATPAAALRSGPLVLATISFALSFAAWGLVGGLASIFATLYSLTAFQTALLVAVPVLLGSLARLPMGTYPDEHEPCLLVRLTVNEFVAFNQKCTHLSAR